MKKYLVTCLATTENECGGFHLPVRVDLNNDYIFTENEAEAIDYSLENIRELCMENENVDYCEVDYKSQTIIVYDFDGKVIEMLDYFKGELIE